jgi:hypothetical protein
VKNIFKKAIPKFAKSYLKSFKKKIVLYLNRGCKYECPFCGFNSKGFALGGSNFEVIQLKEIVGAGRRYHKCFKCRSTDRERLVYMYLKEERKIFEDSSVEKVLHIAPEERLSNELAKAEFKEYVRGDLFEGYTYDEKVENIDVRDIPYPDNYFDLIICNHVLEHVPEDMEAIKELFRVTKPSGFAILQVPISLTQKTTFEDPSITDPSEREKVFGQCDHVRIYGLDYAKKLSRYGFNVQQSSISKKYAFYGTNSAELLFIASK